VDTETGAVTLDDARAFLARTDEAFASGDMDAVLDLMSEDVHVVFADFPPMRGRAAYGDFLRSRQARQLNYQPLATVRAVCGSVIGSSWEATWTDATTGLEMSGRGCEFVTLRDGRVVEFIASFNAWDARTGPRTPIV
jgi:ketosteroid isomerase-like protein